MEHAQRSATRAPLITPHPKATTSGGRPVNQLLALRDNRRHSARQYTSKMRIGKLVAAILFYCHFGTALGARCRGGRSARGVSSPDELSSEVDADSHRLRTASCCEEDGSCHGGYLLAGHQLDGATAGSTLLSHYAQQRRKRSLDEYGDYPPLTSCCPANVSVFFPISAISVKTGKRVHVIQAPPIVLQAVLFARCDSDKSPLLDADCQQEFVTEMMHVAHFDEETQELLGAREPVFVENGCSCRMSNRDPPKATDGATVHDAVAKFLTMW